MTKTTRILIVLMLLLTFQLKVDAQSVSATNSWTYSVLSTDITEAGNDFVGTYLSASSQTLVTSTVSGNNLWTIYINRTSGTWNSNIIIQAKRTTNGSGTGSISGGSTFQTLTTTATSFYNGRRTRNNVGIQYQLSGISVALPAKSYSTNIVYTITSP